MNVVAIGFLINSALFLAGIVAAGLVSGNHIAVLLALATVGACCLCYMTQMIESKLATAVALVFYAASWGFGIAAFAVLARGLSLP